MLDQPATRPPRAPHGAIALSHGRWTRCGSTSASPPRRFEPGGGTRASGMPRYPHVRRLHARGWRPCGHCRLASQPSPTGNSRRQFESALEAVVKDAPRAGARLGARTSRSRFDGPLINVQQTPTGVSSTTRPAASSGSQPGDRPRARPPFRASPLSPAGRSVLARLEVLVAHVRAGPLGRHIPPDGGEEAVRLRRWLVQDLVRSEIVAHEARSRGSRQPAGPHRAQSLADVDVSSLEAEAYYQRNADLYRQPEVRHVVHGSLADEPAARIPCRRAAGWTTT